MSTFTHINAEEVARKAASDFGLSMKDDPTQWAEGSRPSLLEVQDACAQTANSNVRSALSRSIGKVAEQIATDMEGAIAEDGALADLDGVFAVYVSGIKPDFDAVLQAPDWEARVEALRTSVAQAVHAWPASQVSAQQLKEYIASDARLAHLKDLGDAMDPGEIPPHLRRSGGKSVVPPIVQTAPIEPVAQPTHVQVDEWDDTARAAVKSLAEGLQNVADEWDTETEIASAAGALEPPSWDDDEPKPLFIPDMVAVAGVQDQDAAAIFGVSKSYYSMIRNRKRPWPGMKPDQIERLRVELKAHEQAIAALYVALNDAQLTKPST